MSSSPQPRRAWLRPRLPALIGWLAVAILLAFAFAWPGAAGAHNTSSPGNNGTVKIHEGGTEPSPEVQNQPHVCTFHLHFFFADAGQTGTWWIESWPPTGSRSVVLSGTYGPTDANGVYRTPPYPDFYTLPDGHYKLFWEGRNDQNIKHKVFWVQCAAPTATPTATPGGTVAPTETATATSTEVATATPTEVATAGIRFPRTEAAGRIDAGR